MMKYARSALGALVLAWGCLMGCSSSEGTQTQPAVSWHQDIRPIFDAYCNDCHQAEGVAPCLFSAGDV